MDEAFVNALKNIFEESMLGEIKNVIDDAQKCNGGLTHRGHVVGLALMCALDAIASYGYRNHYWADFINAHFRPDYRPYAVEIYKLCRCSLVHDWNLFEATIYPDGTKIRSEHGVMAFGLLDFFDVLVHATNDFLNQLETDKTLQGRTLQNYGKLKASAKT